MSAANACWIVLCKCMLDIKCSVLRGWSCAITKSFEFWLRTDEKMGLTLSVWNRGDCVAWRRLQQDVSTRKWAGKESQQRLSFNHVHVMKPMLVQKRRRCSASQVADF